MDVWDRVMQRVPMAMAWYLVFLLCGKWFVLGLLAMEMAWAWSWGVLIPRRRDRHDHPWDCQDPPRDCHDHRRPRAQSRLLTLVDGKPPIPVLDGTDASYICWELQQRFPWDIGWRPVRFGSHAVSSIPAEHEWWSLTLDIWRETRPPPPRTDRQGWQYHDVISRQWLPRVRGLVFYRRRFWRCCGKREPSPASTPSGHDDHRSNDYNNDDDHHKNDGNHSNDNDDNHMNNIIIMNGNSNAHTSCQT